MTKTERDRDLTRRCITEKWALLAAHQTIGEPKCPLCVEYGDCVGCPIYEKTAQRGCHGTPYFEWAKKRTSASIQDMTDWLWALYDELTEKMLAERKSGAPRREGCRDGLTPCTICGREADMYRGDTPVCVRCHRECYDANGNYLVPVVRGGLWHRGDEKWERSQDGEHQSYDPDGYRVSGGRIEVALDSNCKDWGLTGCCAVPGVVLKAPRGYTGPLPEGCRWAEGSEPKPYRVLEASLDGATWCEVSRTYSEGEVQWTDPGKFHSVRIRHVDADGKTQKTIVTRQASEPPAKPRPKADAIPGLGPLIPTLARHEDVTELRSDVRQIGSLVSALAFGCREVARNSGDEKYVERFRNLTEMLDAVLSRMMTVDEVRKGEWRGGLAWE